MYHMLIVEDEPRQLRALVNIIRQFQPEITVSEAYDGQMALEFMEKHPVDVVITDIRMPNMDGMKLIEALHHQKSTAKIILLSGYGEFSYAQKAIKFGIFDYVVKPVSKDDIHKLLTKVEQAVRKERQERTDIENMSKKLDDTFPVYISYLLNKWIHGSIHDSEIQELGKAFMIRGSGITAVTEINKFEQFSSEHSHEGIENILQRILHLLKECSGQPAGQAFSFMMEGSRNKFITIFGLKNNSPRYINEVTACLDKLIYRVEMEHGFDLTVGISKGSDSIFHDIALSYEQAITALNRKFYDGVGKVIPFVEVPLTHEPNRLYQKEEELKQAVRKSEVETVSQIVNNYFERTVLLYKMDPDQVKEELIHVMLNQIGAIKHLLTEQNYNQLVSEIRTDLSKCEDYRELRHIAKKKLQQLIDLTHGSEDKNSVIIKQCQNYIEVHYAEDISLDTLAQKYHFNASYFSNLFKTYAGVGLSEFVIKVRVKKALQFLLNSNDKMSEIASKVGYKDAAYFIRVFKKEMGTSPHKYRHLKGNE